MTKTTQKILGVISKCIMSYGLITYSTFRAFDGFFERMRMC